MDESETVAGRTGRCHRRGSDRRQAGS